MKIKEKKSRSLAMYIMIFSLLLLSVYGLYNALTRGSASAWYYKADFVINDWAAKGRIKNKAQYYNTLEAISKAQSLDSSHPHYAHMLGRVIHWGVNVGFEEKDRLTEVKRWYLLSTNLRPLWPDPWIDLAQLNNYLVGYTPETKYYLERAIKTGPYIPLVTSGVLQVLLLNWAVLSGTELTLLFDQFAIVTTQRNGLSNILSFAKGIGREKLLCIQINFNPLYVQQKKSYLYKKHCN